MLVNSDGLSRRMVGHNSRGLSRWNDVIGRPIILPFSRNIESQYDDE